MRVRLKLDRLLDLVARSHLSQNHWAIKLGISRGHWSAILNGKYPFPSPKTRTRLLEIFGVEFDELFEVDSGPEGDADANFQAALADRYLIDREIGQGGMGTVYLARDVKHNRTVALKVISPEAVGGIGIPQFLKETRYAARLQHQHVIPVYDSGEAAGSPFYVTPFIEDGSLRSRLERRGALPFAEAVQIADQVAQALAYAHDRQILHCDIKPENILVSGTGRHLHVWVADFGISRVIHAETGEWSRKGELDSSAGTPAYVSPEQASGERTLTPASDVYSLACMLFECLTGTPPFRGATTMEVVSRRFVSEAPDVRRLAPDVPGAAATALRAAMAIDPVARMATPTALVDKLLDAARRPPPRIVRHTVAGGRRLLTRLARTLLPQPSRRRQTFMDRLRQDLAYAMRSLHRRPLFAAVVLGTLALGIGMNTAIFSVLHGVLYRPLPYAEPDELVRIGRTRPELPNVLLPISPGDLWELTPQVTTLARIEAEFGGSFVLTGRGEPTRLSGATTTHGFFELLGVPPALGRTFSESDATPGAEPVVLVSHGLWQTQLGADSSVIGTSLRLNDQPHTVIGVMDSEFEFNAGALWVPLVWTDNLKTFRRSNYVRLYGRLAPGASAEQSISELHELWTRQGAQYGDQFDDSGMSLIPLRDAFVGRSRTALLVLGGAVLFVLLIACANVANLWLARSEVRQREIAVRAALGAGRGRLARQFLTESVLTALIGGTAGVGLAFLGVRAILAAYGDAIPRAEEIGINGSVLGFSLLVSVGTGLLVGLVPALQIRPDHAALKEGTRGGSSRVTLFRQGLVATEIAMALMLLTGAGLLIKSFWNAMQSDLGFDRENLVAANFWFPPSRYQNATEIEEFVVNLEAQLEAHPAVASVTMANMVPVRNFGNNFTKINVVGDEERTASFVEYRAVTPDFFEGMGISLIRGQIFTQADARDQRRVIVIDRELTRQLFGDDIDPIGQRLAVGPQEPEIVGVVNDVRSFGPDERPRPTVYFAASYQSNILVRATRDVNELTPIIRNTGASIDRNVALVRVEPMDEIITRSLGDRRFQLSLIGIFAAAALLLGAVGVFGVMSYTVERQTREIGVRMAMGARASDVLRLVLWRTGRLALIGVVVGLVGAVAVRRVLTSMVFEVNTLDPVTYGGVTVGLVMIAMVAGFLPARRAAAVEPTEALRYE